MELKVGRRESETPPTLMAPQQPLEMDEQFMQLHAPLLPMYISSVFGWPVTCVKIKRDSHTIHHSTAKRETRIRFKT